MILQIAQVLLVLTYAIVPVVFLIWAIIARVRRGESSPLISLCLASIAAAVVGAILLMLNAHLMGGRIAPLQSLRFLYFVLGAICLVKVVDYLLLRGAFRVARVQLNALGHPVARHYPRAMAMLFVQRLLVFALIIPYVIALMMTYRPKVLIADSPKARGGLSLAPAQFITRDGLLLSGWWIPAADSPKDSAGSMAGSWGKQTVVVCHGVGSAKEHQLRLARFLVDRGYNVLVFDFRGHGQSAGSFTSYGDRERLDVLAAVQWAKANHADESERVFGIGLNMGAAALLAAAADPEQGHQIDALVLYEPYARFQSLAGVVSRQMLPMPVQWLVDRIGLPLASLHAGADLVGFAPVEYAGSIWPRPALVVHGRGASFIPAYEEMDLYGQMSWPKQQFWPAESYTASRQRIQQAGSEFSIVTEMFRQWIGTAINPADDPVIQTVTHEFLAHARAHSVI